MKHRLLALFLIAGASVSAQDIVDFLTTSTREEVSSFVRTEVIDWIWDAEGRTALMLLLERFDGNVVMEAIDATTDVNVVDDDGWSALMYAAYGTADQAIFEALLSKGADASLASVDDLNLNALQVALWQNRSAGIVRVLIDHTDDVNWQNADGLTALMLAALFHEDVSVVDLLLRSGANTTLQSKSGVDAVGYARRNEYTERDDRVALISRVEVSPFVRAEDNGEVLYAVNFPGIGIVFGPVIELTGFSSVGEHSVLLLADDELYIVTHTAIPDSMLESGSYSMEAVLRSHYDWERSHQEDLGVRSVADFRLIRTGGGRMVSGFVFDHPVDRDLVADTETYRTVGFTFVGAYGFLISVYCPITGVNNESDMASNAIAIIDSTRGFDTVVDAKNIFDLYHRHGQ